MVAEAVVDMRKPWFEFTTINDDGRGSAAKNCAAICGDARGCQRSALRAERAAIVGIAANGGRRAVGESDQADRGKRLAGGRAEALLVFDGNAVERRVRERRSGLRQNLPGLETGGRFPCLLP